MVGGSRIKHIRISEHFDRAEFELCTRVSGTESPCSMFRLEVSLGMGLGPLPIHRLMMPGCCAADTSADNVWCCAADTSADNA